MAAKSELPTPGELLIHEESAAVCRESIVITNPTATAFTAKVGQPILSTGVLAVDAEEASVVGLILENVELAASGDSPFKVGYLARGPAAIDKSKIIVLDSNGATMDIAALVTRLAALGIVSRLEPTKTSTQTN